MGVTLKQEYDNVYAMRITGVLKKSELDAAQGAAAKELEANPLLRVKLMIIAVNFTGWERGVNWDDMSFYTKYGDRITKMAIIGDPKQETEFKMFSGAGFRTAPVKFFPPNQLEQARTWLSEKV
jgi:hypothetical protein